MLKIETVAVLPDLLFHSYLQKNSLRELPHSIFKGLFNLQNV